MQVRVTLTQSSESQDFTLPDDTPAFFDLVISEMTKLGETRIVEKGSFRGSLAAAMSGTIGYVGPAIEIRRIPEPDLDKEFPEFDQESRPIE